MRRIEIDKGKLVLTEGVIGFFQKTVTKFGTGAKIDCIIMKIHILHLQKIR